ncbi:MAG: hypothetical protein HY204_02230 [Nitrospirae bacterium]|nr:hypothetical protein [Nitrospirota bacterium]
MGSRSVEELKENIRKALKPLWIIWFTSMGLSLVSIMALSSVDKNNLPMAPVLGYLFIFLIATWGVSSVVLYIFLAVSNYRLAKVLGKNEVLLSFLSLYFLPAIFIHFWLMAQYRR